MEGQGSAVNGHSRKKAVQQQQDVLATFTVHLRKLARALVWGMALRQSARRPASVRDLTAC